MTNFEYEMQRIEKAQRRLVAILARADAGGDLSDADVDAAVAAAREVDSAARRCKQLRGESGVAELVEGLRARKGAA